MDQAVQENVTLPADELECLLSDSAPASSNDATSTAPRSGFNYNKLYAVLCIGASALVSVTAIAWLVTS